MSQKKNPSSFSRSASRRLYGNDSNNDDYYHHFCMKMRHKKKLKSFAFFVCLVCLKKATDTAAVVQHMTILIEMFFSSIN